MNRRTINYLSTVCACAVALCPTGLFARELRVKTVDAFTGKPVSGVTVVVDFWDDQTTKFTYTRTSDDKGEFRLKRRGFKTVNFFVSATEGNYCTANLSKKFEGKDDAVALVPVAFKGTPAKLKMAEVRLEFPPGCDEMGFDFLKGELLPPAGKGEVADVVFRRMPRTSPGLGRSYGNEPPKPRWKFTLSVDFPGEGNGIQVVPIISECQLWTKNAPETEYKQHYESFHMDDENFDSITSGDSKMAQCFRIRTQKDNDGSVTNGFYGKIYGEFKWITNNYHQAPHIKEFRFTYYLNEKPLDRNLEKDPKDDIMRRFRP